MTTGSGQPRRAGGTLPSALRPASLLRDDRGSAAVEFGMVSLPFLALLGGLLQIAFTMWASQNLDYALQKTVRGLFTGAFQTANSSQTDPAVLLANLKASMCSVGTASAVTVFDCSSIKLDVTLGSSFASSTPLAPVNPTTKDWNAGFGTHYSCAPPGSIVIVTAAVKFPVYFSLLDLGIVSFADGAHLLQSTAVFRTEPYGAPGTASC